MTRIHNKDMAWKIEKFIRAEKKNDHKLFLSRVSSTEGDAQI